MSIAVIATLRCGEVVRELTASKAAELLECGGGVGGLRVGVTPTAETNTCLLTRLAEPLKWTLNPPVHPSFPPRLQHCHCRSTDRASLLSILEACQALDQHTSNVAIAPPYHHFSHPFAAARAGASLSLVPSWPTMLRTLTLPRVVLGE